MLPRVKWGLICGGVVVLLNLCGGILIGAVNNCCAMVTVTIAAIVAGYFCSQQEPAEEAVKAGAIAGAIVGGLSMIGQLIGGIIGGLVGTGLLASLTNQAQTNSFYQSVGVGIGVIVISSLVVGFVMTLAGAGIGALTAKIAVPKVETINPI